MEELQLEGTWWVPDNPEQGVSGRLFFDGSSQPRLELIGALAPMASTESPKTFEIILGVLTSGELFTLVDCTLVNRKFVLFTEIGSSVLQCRFAFRGCHFPDRDMPFQRVAIHYASLGAWAEVTGLKANWETTHEGTLNRLTVTYEYPRFQAVRIDDAIIEIVPWLSNADDGPQSIRLQEKLFYQIELAYGDTLEGYLQRFYHLQNFITLGTAQPTSIVEVRGSPKPGSDVRIGLTSSALPIQIYFSPSRSIRSSDRLHRAQMLFSLSTLGDSYTEYVQRWFAKAGPLKPVMDLYFSTIYDETAYLHSRFLSLAQAVETYHRATSSATYLDLEHFEAVRLALNAELGRLGLAENICLVFSNKLSSLNQLTLRTRIEGIIESRGSVVRMLIPDVKAFVRRVTDTRNYLTHWDQSGRSRAARGLELYKLVEQLRFLLELCFLSEMGIPDETAGALAQNHQRYLALTGLLNPGWRP